ncbi:MAG: CDP-diacylglycerol--glycerol-3-phosphate 3-phosphatidyltransferase [Candidatus Marinimicrobia bacterium]|nr:CDP-diacylglycerol--glycerol-3-phosphate 3-phosphatidyltransferase [Candidatus Neomarinimicrobiota bacterium]MCF7828074.1 CDP-diacylglycerol--glycerol-3-phosphate 3-phosphatidyltransferase [Candidatus Neomarinimicrobiota bacterium]MCF7879751.1 CDP-diacylglycerol--glycerol-3-phosphate 3-phosphatidyltransferase [Candidatus Neomarinimicrobiota bacterium]
MANGSLPHPFVARLPNILTYLRILLTPVFLILIFSAGYVNHIFALLVFIIASTSDAYDGYIARKYDIVTEHGKFVDPLADKILVLSAFFGFWYLDLFPFWMLAIIILRDVVITGLRMWMIVREQTMETSIFGKSKTAVQMTAIYILIVFVTIRGWELFDFLSPALMWIYTHNILWWMMLAVSLLTAASGIHYLKVNWGTIKQFVASQS